MPDWISYPIGIAIISLVSVGLLVAMVILIDLLVDIKKLIRGWPGVASRRRKE